MNGVNDDAARSNSDPDNSPVERSGSFDYGRSDRPASKAESEIATIGPGIDVYPGSVERVREAINQAHEETNWRDFLVVGGALLLGLCVIATLILAGAINARANRIIRADLQRDKVTAERNAKVDEFIQRIDGQLSVHFQNFDEHAKATRP